MGVDGREGRDTGGAQAWTELWMEGKGRKTGGAWVCGRGWGRKGGERDGRHGCGRGCGWKERDARRDARGCGWGWGEGRGADGAGERREVDGCGRGRGERCMSVDGAGEGRGGERDGRWVWTGLWMEGNGRETGGAWVWTGLWREGAKWNEAWRGPMLLHAVDMLVTRTWLHHKHHCRLLRVSSQVERSMGAGSSVPCFAEARSDARGAVLRGLYDGLGCPNCAQCMRQTVKSWPKRQACQNRNA